ncbi:hypothetical protein GMA11_00095 [Granulicatella sp. zg-ZJ]|uniref:hypothetical protein n=1 Tax=Granulicatella sp. zg-ZJ TaxID=2678504 RepID=UPI0013CF7952|nr:hypothetical protein [Granulicatella sp. zg-ZJ]MBS4749651.1 hypothetical protein [Carnobacteriaceae bacterium zg-ZUI78]NEW61780.1 hypothetical protein [Granulicatella sp. zg-ZJ]
MDLNTFIKQLKYFASHPVIKLFIMPLTLILFGTSFGSKGNPLNLVGAIVFYFFMLMMQFIEQYLFINVSKRGYVKWQPLYMFELIILIFLVLLYYITNIIFTILAFLYVVSTHLMYAPFKLKGTIYYIILQVFLKGLVVTILASFIQVNLITMNLFVAILPLVSGLLVYYAESEKLDIVKYGMVALPKNLLRYLSIAGLIGMAVFPFAIGRVALTNILFDVLLVGIVGLFIQFMFKNKHYLNTGKSKNYLSSLYTLYVLLLSLF